MGIQLPSEVLDASLHTVHSDDDFRSGHPARALVTLVGLSAVPPCTAHGYFQGPVQATTVTPRVQKGATPEVRPPGGR